jgi:integrase
VHALTPKDIDGLSHEQPEQEAAFFASASAPLCLALLLALYTGQRQGDLLALKWFAYDRISG